MAPVRTTLLALFVTAVATSASAQTNPLAQPAPAPPRPPAIIISPNDLYRGPPLPPDRPDPPPRSAISPPMERVPQVAPMSPRVGN